MLITALFRKGKITQLHISRLGLEPTKMADKNCVEDILGSMLPKQSQKVYEHTWKEFIEFAGHDNPAEGNFIQYFHFLRETKSMKASTIWSTYSRLNSVYQTKTGKRLQQWPRITQLLSHIINLTRGRQRRRSVWGR